MLILTILLAVVATQQAIASIQCYDLSQSGALDGFTMTYKSPPDLFFRQFDTLDGPTQFLKAKLATAPVIRDSTCLVSIYKDSRGSGTDTWTGMGVRTTTYGSACDPVVLKLWADYYLKNSRNGEIVYTKCCSTAFCGMPTDQELRAITATFLPTTATRPLRRRRPPQRRPLRRRPPQRRRLRRPIQEILAHW